MSLLVEEQFETILDALSGGTQIDDAIAEVIAALVKSAIDNGATQEQIDKATDEFQKALFHAIENDLPADEAYEYALAIFNVVLDIKSTLDEEGQQLLAVLASGEDQDGLLDSEKAPDGSAEDEDENNDADFLNEVVQKLAEGKSAEAAVKDAVAALELSAEVDELETAFLQANPTGKLVSALNSGQDVDANLQQFAGGREVDGLENAIGQSLQTGVSPEVALKAAEQKVELVETLQANVPESLVAALSSGSSVDAAIKTAGGGEPGSSFEQDVSRSLEAGATPKAAAQAAVEVAEQTIQVSASAKQTLIAALASGQRVEKALEQAGGSADPQGFEQKLEISLAGGAELGRAATQAQKEAVASQVAEAEAPVGILQALASGQRVDQVIQVAASGTNVDTFEQALEQTLTSDLNPVEAVAQAAETSTTVQVVEAEIVRNEEIAQGIVEPVAEPVPVEVAANVQDPVSAPEAVVEVPIDVPVETQSEPVADVEVASLDVQPEEPQELASQSATVPDEIPEEETPEEAIAEALVEDVPEEALVEEAQSVEASDPESTETAPPEPEAADEQQESVSADPETPNPETLQPETLQPETPQPETPSLTVESAPANSVEVASKSVAADPVAPEPTGPEPVAPAAEPETTATVPAVEPEPVALQPFQNPFVQDPFSPSGTSSTQSISLVLVPTSSQSTQQVANSYNPPASVVQTSIDLTTTGAVEEAVPTPNFKPVGDVVSASGPEDTAAITITLTGSDPDGVIASFRIATLPSNGALFSDSLLTNQLSANNIIAATAEAANVYFVPNLNYYGSPSFTFVAVDNTGEEGGTSSANITVTPVNDAPETIAASVTGLEDASSIIVALSGTDIDGTVANFKILTLPTDGLLYSDAGLNTLISMNGLVAATGNVANVYFVPTLNFNGSPSFTYASVDDGGLEDVSASTANITVTAVNDASETLAATGSGLEDAASITIALSGTDVDGTVASFRILTLPTDGLLYSDAAHTNPLLINDTVTATTNAANVYFVPTADFNGTPSFTYASIDDLGLEDASAATANITVISVNDAPVTLAASGVGLEDAARITIALSGTDIDGLINNFKILTLPTNGTLYSDFGLTNAISANGLVNALSNAADIYFVPNLNTFGTPSFTYTSVDGFGLEDATPITVGITVTSVNDAPETLAASGSGSEDAPSIVVALSGTDVDGTVVNFKILTLPTDGVLYSDAALNNPILMNGLVAATTNAANVYFVPTLDFNGTQSFTYASIDDLGLEDVSPITAGITVSAVNDAPDVSGPVTGTATEDGASSTLNPLANASDVESGTNLSVVNIPGSLPAGVTYVDGTPPVGTTVAGLTITNTTNITLARAQTESGDDLSENPNVVTGAVGQLLNYTATGNFLSFGGSVHDVHNLNDGDVGAGVVSDGTYAIPDVGNSSIVLDFGAVTSIGSIAIYTGYGNRVDGDYTLKDGAGNILGGWTISNTTTGNNDGVPSFWLTFDTPVSTDMLVFDTNSTEFAQTNSYREIQVFGEVQDGFVLDPTDAAYQTLAVGETTTVTVDYGVSDGALTTPASVSWTVTGTNDDPVVTGATNTTTGEATPVAITGLTVSDVDGDSLNVTLTATTSVSLAQTTGLTNVTGNGTATVTFTGSETDINAALNGMSYTPSGITAGQETLKIDVTDPTANTTATQTVLIDVTASADAPTVSISGPATNVGEFGVFGVDIQVDGDTAVSARAPAIEALTNGGFAIAWSQGSNGGHAIYTKMFDASGAATTTSNLINSNTGGAYQWDPSITAFDTTYTVNNVANDLLVMWEDRVVQNTATTGASADIDRKFAKQDLSGFSFEAQESASFGFTPVGEPSLNFQIAGVSAGQVGGGYATVWNSFGQDGDGYGVYGNFYNSSGALVNSSVLINTTTAGNQLYPAITGLDGGGYGVVWRGTGLHYQQFSSSGGLLGSEMTFAGGFDSPSINQLTNGNMLAVAQSGQNVYATIFNNNGTIIAAPFILNGSTTANGASNPSATALSNGGFFVVWIADDGNGSVSQGVFGQEFNSTGGAVGSVIQINDTTAGNQYTDRLNGDEVVTQLNDGTIVVAFTNGTDLFARLIKPVQGIDENTPFNLNVAAALTDTDGSETLAVTLTGLPAGFIVTSSSMTVTSDGTNPTDVTGFDLANLVVTPSTNFEGTISITAIATSTETGNAVTASTSSSTLDVTIVDGDDLPVLADVVSSVTFAENTVNVTPQIIDASVTFTDIEGDFTGGTLVVSGFVNGEDTIAINNEGTGAGQISVDGSNVRYANDIIGTFTGGSGATNLTITFDSSASVAGIDALIQNLTYANSSDTPTAARTLTITITDAAAGASVTNVTVNVTDENDAPVLNDFASTVTFGENLVNTTPQILDASVTFTDIEGNFDGGTLVVSGFVSGEDTIAINNEGTGAGQISVDGTNVRYANTVIGTYVGGTGAVGLTVTLNSAAASEAIDALVQNLTYANSSDSPTAARTLTVTITDDAAKTDSVTMTVNVTPEFEAPIANDDTGTATAFSSTSVFSSLDAIVTNDSHAAPLGIKEDQIIINDGSGGLTTSIISADVFRAPDVKIGDFDGDGDLDALLANLYLLTNQGGAEGGTEGTFVSSLVTGGIGSAQGLAVGDIDGDGDLDAIYANWGSSYSPNDLLINQGGAQGGTQGQFVISTETAGGDNHSRDVALGDIDGDGDLDAIVANDTSANQLLINDGTGSFSLSSIAAAVSQASPVITTDVIIADLNADGHLDVVFTNSSGQNELLINNGSGVFSASVLVGGTYNSAAVVSGDLDGDGDLDLIIANGSGAANQVVLNQGGVQGGSVGTFVASTISGSNGNSTDVALADIDGDGDLDAIVTNNGWSTSAEKNQLLTNNGSGNFTVSDLVGDGNPSNSIVFGDLDGNGTNAAVESDGLPNVGLDPVRGTVAANDTDPQGASLTYALDAPIDGLTMYANGAWLFDQTHASYNALTFGQTQNVVANYTVTNAHGFTDQATLTITVTGSNDNITLANAAVLNFDGTNDYVDIGNAAPANSGLGDLSVEAWFYWDGTAPATTEFLVAKGDAGSTDIGWSMSITAAGDLTMAVNSTGDGIDAGNAIGDISLTSETIGWQHAAFVFDSDGTNGVLTGYLNGSSANWAVTGTDTDGSLALGASGITNAQSMTIGAVDGVSGGVISGQFEGGIDEVRIWNVARTSTEINNEMNQTLNGSETGLTGLWQLNSDANDASTNSNNGTINGGAMFESQPAASTTSGSIYRALLLAEVLDDKDLTYTINTQPNNGTITLDGAEVIYNNNGTVGADSFTIDINDGNQTITETIDVSVVSGFG